MREEKRNTNILALYIWKLNYLLRVWAYIRYSIHTVAAIMSKIIGRAKGFLDGRDLYDTNLVSTIISTWMEFQLQHPINTQQDPNTNAKWCFNPSLNRYHASCITTSCGISLRRCWIGRNGGNGWVQILKWKERDIPK